MQAARRITTQEIRQAHALPKSDGLPLVGSFPQLWQNQMDFFLDAWKQHGDIYECDSGLISAIIVNHPDYAQHVLRDNWRNYAKGGEMYDSIRSFVETSVLTIDNEVWKHYRPMMQPQFHRQHLAGLTQLMVEAIDECFAEWDSLAESGEAFDAASAFNKMTMIVILRAMFGRNLKINSLDKISDDIEHNAYQETLHEFDAFIYDIIEQHRQSSDKRNDLLAMLLNIVDDESGDALTDRELRDEAALVFAAAYEISSVAMTWALYQLALNKDIEQTLAQSVDTTLCGQLATFADFHHLDYPRMVMEETMRLYPPVYFIPRRAIERDIIGGHRIDAGQLVFVMTYMLHRHPDFWDKPQIFDPQRFAKDNGKIRHPLAYMPFGIGQGSCTGKDFAMMEGTLILSQFAQRYRVHLVANKTPELSLSTTPGNKDGIWVTIEKR